MARLSILIPARNEEFLQRTIDDVFEHAKGDTEILVALDNWEVEKPTLKEHPKLRIIETALGQRGATNALAKLSEAKYVMKLDAHCSLSPGFDIAMMEEMQDDAVLVPCLHNLHAYDWVCEKGHRHFQGKYEKCEQCGSTELKKQTVWQIIAKPSMVSYYFDSKLHFQYLEKQSEEMTPETMSIQGSCFMAPRELYFDLDLCSESFGSWGQQGTEVACKMWLSGHKVRSTRKAFYGHQFRETEGFPYLNKVEDIFKAQDFSRNLFLKNAWIRQVRSFQSLIEQFNYPGDWTPEILDNLTTPWAQGL